MDYKEEADRLVVKWRHHGLKIAGACGLVAPLAAFACIALAILAYPSFSWEKNALSDLGVAKNARAFFNNGLMVAGIILAGFATGLPLLLRKSRLSYAACALFLLDCLALVAIGVFPSSARPMHYYASVAFFALFPISCALAALSLWQSEKKGLARLAVAASALAAFAWVAQLALSLFPNVAIPEAVAACAAGVWVAACGRDMLKSASE
jgi:hypothetical membrane protein